MYKKKISRYKNVQLIARFVQKNSGKVDNILVNMIYNVVFLSFRHLTS